MDACVRTAWKSASEALDRAAQLDPVDARVAAYRNVVAEAAANGSERAPAPRGNCSGGGARALMGTVSSRPTTSRCGCTAGADGGCPFCNTATQWRGRPHDEALADLCANVGIESRFTRDDWVQLVATAMLPDPQQTPTRSGRAIAGRASWRGRGWSAARTLIAGGPARRGAAGVPAPSAAPRELAGDRQKTGRTEMIRGGFLARLGHRGGRGHREGLRPRRSKLLMSGEGWPWHLPQELETRRKALANRSVSRASKLRWTR